MAHATVAQHVNLRDHPEKCWKAPAQDWYKGNWDAAFEKETGRMGLGVVVWDSARGPQAC